MVPRPGAGINRPGPRLACRRLHELGVERLEEFAPAYRAQELLQPLERRMVIRPDGHLEPLGENLGVAGCGETEFAVEPLQVRLAQRSQEMQPLVCGPRARIDGLAGAPFGPRRF